MITGVAALTTLGRGERSDLLPFACACFADIFRKYLPTTEIFGVSATICCRSGVRFVEFFPKTPLTPRMGIIPLPLLDEEGSVEGGDNHN